MKNKFILFILLILSFPAFSQSPLTDSLIAYYPYNGNAIDATGNGSNGTVHGATLTTDRFGNLNSAYFFNYANNDYIDYTPGPKFQPTSLPVTITAWVKPNCSTQGNVFLNDYTSGSVTESGLFFNVNSVYVANGVDGSICDGSGIGPGARRSIFGSKNVNNNQWHFIAVVYRSITDMDIYIDCNYDKTGVYDGSGGQLYYFGHHGSSGVRYNGVIDEIRFYHKALTQSDLQTIYAYPALDVSANPPIINCSQNSSTLTVSGNTNYTWSPSTGLNSTIGSTVIANPPTSTTYTVTLTLGGGKSCPLTNTVVVTLGNGGVIPGIVTAIRDTICRDSDGNLILSNNSSNTIQWQSSTNNADFTDVTGANNSTYKTQPLQQTTWYRAVVSNGNCSAISDTLQLYVPPPLISYFNFTQLAPNQLSFNSDSSLGNIVTYHWDFGDMNTSTDKNPTHTYSKDSTYYVCLTLYDGSNCSYTYCKYSNVTDGVPPILGEGNWVIYPEPVTNFLTIKTRQTNNPIQQIEMFDVLGRLMINRKIRELANTSADQQLDVSTLAKGMYFLIIKTSNGDNVRKIVKQ